jgi:hypothetical protein
MARRAAWARMLALHVQIASQPRALDEPAPTLVPAMLAADVSARRQRAINGPVRQCPPPRLHLRLAAYLAATSRAGLGVDLPITTITSISPDMRARRLSAHTTMPPRGRADVCRTAHLTHQQLIRCDQRKRRPCHNHAGGRRRHRDRDVRRQACHAARGLQRPRQDPAATARPRLGQQRRGCGDDHPVHRQRRQCGRSFTCSKNQSRHLPTVPRSRPTARCVPSPSPVRRSDHLVHGHGASGRAGRHRCAVRQSRHLNRFPG